MISIAPNVHLNKPLVLFTGINIEEAEGFLTTLTAEMCKTGHRFANFVRMFQFHPKTYRTYARKVVQAINSGEKLVVITHSDYFYSQLCNLVVLGSVSEDRYEQRDVFLEKHGYSLNETIDFNKISAFELTANALVPVEITRKGLFAPSFDDEILSLSNEISELYNVVLND